MQKSEDKESDFEKLKRLSSELTDFVSQFILGRSAIK